MIELLLPAIILIAIAFAGFAIKMFFIKGAKFSKSCSSIDTGDGKKIGCTCSTNTHETCENYTKHHG
jgi:hypothetical protein